MAAKLLFSTTLWVGTQATDQTGFDRDSGANTGRLTVDDWTVLGTSQATRVIRLFLDESASTLTMRVNRRQDVKGKWLKVGDDWLHMDDFATGTGAETVTFQLNTMNPHWTTKRWADEAYLTVGVWDSDPAHAPHLLRRPPERLWSATMTVGTSGDNHGWRNTGPNYGALEDADGDDDRSVDTPDGGQNLNWIYYTDTSGSEALHIEAGSAANASRLNGLWFAFRGSKNGLFATRVTSVTNDATLTVVTQPDDPEWEDDDEIEVSVWDEHPEALITPDGIAVQPGSRYFI